MGMHTLEVVLCFLFSALLITSLFRKLRLSIIVGYLLAGALIGPNALAIADNSEFVRELAEFGIVFLMFTVGLEFPSSKLFSLRYPVFVIGGLQVLVTMGLTAAACILFGLSSLVALIIASIITMSSTAIVVKQLHDQAELHSAHGLTAVGILLFQDLAVIPIIILIGDLAKSAHQPLATLLLTALFKGIVAIVLIFIIGRWLFKPLFRIIAKTRTPELFTLTVLLVTLTGAWLTNSFGLSYALGAFLAGLMLADTEFRHQIDVEIRPFRDILLGLFFLSIGMLTNIHSWYGTWYWILLLVLALTLVKMAIVTLIAYFSGHPIRAATRTGVILGQGGEFGFAILTLALTHHLLSYDSSQIILAGLLISIAISPLFIRFNKGLAHAVCFKKSPASAHRTNSPLQEEKELFNHVVVCGYGRVGQHILQVLSHMNFPYICLDLDAELVSYAAMAGDNVMYGDSTHPGILGAAGIDRAKILVISFNDLSAAKKILKMLHQSHPHLPKLVRCTDEFEFQRLKACGATHVIAEVFEASLAFSNHLLHLLGIPTHQISELLQHIRHKNYTSLEGIYDRVDNDQGEGSGKNS